VKSEVLGAFAWPLKILLVSCPSVRMSVCTL